MKSEIREILARIELAERCAAQVTETLEQAPALPPEERSWLVAAQRRLGERVAVLQARIEESVALPEFKAVRAERQQRLEREWLAALNNAFSELVAQVSVNSPLVEALFPHQRFEKLERGGATLSAYRAEFALRRSSGYVRRLSADPEYPFLLPLLEPIDRMSDALAALGVAAELDEAAIAELRAPLTAAADELARSLRQARSLCEAALLDEPELLAAFKFDERPRRRSESS